MFIELCFGGSWLYSFEFEWYSCKPFQLPLLRVPFLGEISYFPELFGFIYTSWKELCAIETRRRAKEKTE